MATMALVVDNDVSVAVTLRAMLWLATVSAPPAEPDHAANDVRTRYDCLISRYAATFNEYMLFLI